MCVGVHWGSFICILRQAGRRASRQAGRQAGFWQSQELWNRLSLQFCCWLDQPIPLYLAKGSPNPTATVTSCEILFHFTTLTDKKACTRLCQPETPCHIHLVNRSREKTVDLAVSKNVLIHMHSQPLKNIIAPPASMCSFPCTQTRPRTRACHLHRHIDTSPIIRARRWQTTQPWVVVKTKAIHILRNKRSVQLTLCLPLSPNSPSAFYYR